MYSRLLKAPASQSFFLFGPRGTGKSTWLRKHFPQGLFLDLLNTDLYRQLKAKPSRLRTLIPPKHQGWVILDEVQKVPELLSEVHALIEEKPQFHFALTGSSARSLRRRGVHLLGGRARRFFLHPLTTAELKQDFNLEKALQYGHLPTAVLETDPATYLSAYIDSYIREEVQQEGLTRNIGNFHRFLEAISFSQGSVLNLSAVARDCGVGRKLVEAYVEILEDLLLAYRLPAFNKRARRQLSRHPKFFFFDAGVYQSIRPKGPLDSPEEIQGSSLETIFFQELRAINDYGQLGYDLTYWREASGKEVDFIAYGQRGFKAFEIKRSRTFAKKHLRGLKSFLKDYPQAKAYLLYGGEQTYYEAGITVMPFEKALKGLMGILE